MFAGLVRPIARGQIFELGRRLVREDDGQDVLEYALLTASIGLAGLAVMNAMGVTLSTAYVSWNTAIDSLWEPEEAAPKG